MSDDPHTVRLDCEDPHVVRWAAGALGALGAAFAVLLVVYEQMGWPSAHGVAGAALAAAVLAGTARVTNKWKGKLRTATMNAIGAAGIVVGIVALPTSVHLTWAAFSRIDPVAWPYGGLFEVPRLAGDEPVRGTGCGAHPHTKVTGTSIPDGTWFGAVRGLDDTNLIFDLICAYSDEDDARLNPSYADLAATGRIARHPAASATWLTLNANSKVRTVAIGPNFRYREASWTAAGECVDDRAGGRLVTDVEVWLLIEDGRAVLAVRVCDVPDGTSSRSAALRRPSDVLRSESSVAFGHF